jgi:galactose mutarotase-like enzyme
MPSRITTGHESGWKSVTLENDGLQVVVLPDKGAEIHKLIDRRTGVDLLFKAPWGLQPPGAPPLPGSGDDEFLWNYAGGWQELLPSVNEACTYRGNRIPFHGEVATLPWDYEVVRDGDTGASVRFSASCRSTPFVVQRTLSVSDSDAELRVESRVTNRSDQAAHLVWGQHLVIGPPFLEAGCRIGLPARTIVTGPTLWEPETARLEPGQREAWPHARLRNGGTVDLRDVPGPEAGSHDDLYVTDFEEGRLSVRNPRLELEMTLEWDPMLYRWVILWQPYGGAIAPPLTGSYALGLEPWTGRLNLEQAVAEGEAVELGAGDSLTTGLRVGVDRG